MWPDTIGMTAPAALFAATALAVLLIALTIESRQRAGSDAAYYCRYGGLAVMFAYIPYATGYVSFRMAALASNTPLVLRAAAAGLALSLLIGFGFTIVGQTAAAAMFVLVLGIPCLAGMIACVAQLAAMRRTLPLLAQAT